MDQSLYQERVKEGAKLYKQVVVMDGEIYRLKKQIAKIALEVCDIRHGGRSGDRYTLTRFADDAKIPRKTISEWVRIFRLSKVLGVEISSDKNWRKVDYVSRKRALMISGRNHQAGKVSAKARIEDITPSEADALKKIYQGAADVNLSKKSEDVNRGRGLNMLLKVFQSNLKSVAFLSKSDLSKAEIKHFRKLLDQTQKHIDRALKVERED